MSLRACQSVTWPVGLTDWLTDARWPTGEVRRSDATRCDARDGEREGGEGGGGGYGMACESRGPDPLLQVVTVQQQLLPPLCTPVVPSIRLDPAPSGNITHGGSPLL